MKLTTKQQIRVDILSQYIDGRIFPDDAARAIGVKERQFRRLVKAFREEGIMSVVHGNHGKTPPNATSDFTKHNIIKLYKGRYLGLNLVHFREKLEENHPEFEVIPSYSTIRNIFIKEEVHFPKIVKKSSVHRMRKRYAKEGMMVQIDGSPHRWIYGHQPFCLTAAIDDATGKIVGAKFTKTETTFAAMDVVESIIEKYGRFQMLYSDKAGIYGGGKRDGYSNMNRAMRELEIIPIQANTPQAKGRVERLFKTLQSRLTSEIMLEKISTIEEANIYLEETFITKFNIRFGKIAEDLETAYRPLLLGQKLKEIFYAKVDRVIQEGHVINFESIKYIVTTVKYGSLVKKNVEMRKYRNGDLKVFLCSGVEVDYKILELEKQVG